MPCLARATGGLPCFFVSGSFFLLSHPRHFPNLFVKSVTAFFFLFRQQVCLAFTYSSNHGAFSHKVGEAQLIQHLNKLDPSSSKGARERTFGIGEWEGLLDLFVKQHYLTKEREDPADAASVQVFGVGPRAYVEIGRRQIIYFTHEAVEAAVDQSLLDELKEDDEDEEASGGEGTVEVA